MTRRRIAWSTAFVATLLGSTGLHLAAAVITAQAGVGPTTSAVPPPLQGAALGPEAYPVDMSAPQTARPEVFPAETIEDTTSTADQPTEAPAPVLVEMRATQPIRLFPAGLYGGAIWHAALPSSAGDAWARAEAILATETAAAAPEAGNPPAQRFETVAPAFAAELRARQPIALFPARLYGGTIRHAALPSSAGDAWARAEAILATETAAAAPEAGNPPAQPVQSAALPVAADMQTRQPVRLFPAGLYGGAIRHAALPSSAGDARARAEAIPTTEPAAAAPEARNLSAQPVQSAALPVTADMRTRQPVRLFPAGLYGGVIRHAAIPESTGDALARAEALLATGTAAAAPEVVVQTAALPAIGDMGARQPIPLFSAGLHDPVTRDPALPDRRHPAAPAHAVLPAPLTVALDPSRTEADTAQMFADSRPLASADLDEMRGGVFDVDGWKIAFGVSIDVKLDQDFQISTFLNPVTQRGRFALNLRNKLLVRHEDGTIDLPDGASITERLNGREIAFDDGSTASIRETDDGFDLSADGERPVELSVTPAQVVQLVGSEDRTLARHQLSPGEIVAQLNNIQNNGRASSLATIAIDILNHTERVSVNRTLRRAEHLNQLVVRDIVGRIGR